MSPKRNLGETELWVFDLDETLYPPGCGLFAQVSERITLFVMRELGLPRAEAEALRSDYWRRYGTTLAGLMQAHDTPPEPFLQEVHAIALDDIAPNPRLAAAIGALPGRKVVHTNGSREHARRVTAALGLSACFEALFGVEDANYLPKPVPEAHALVLEKADADPPSAAMVEDSVKNLVEPHRLGMATIWTTQRDAARPDHVHHLAPDLTAFLERVVQKNA